MIIKSSKNVFVDEIHSLLNIMNNVNIQRQYDDDLYENKVNLFIENNFRILYKDKLIKYIEFINKFNLLPEEKFKIINYKPKNMLELNLILPNIEQKLKK